MGRGPQRLAWFLDEIQHATDRLPRPHDDDLTWLTEAVVPMLTADRAAEWPDWFGPDYRELTGWTAYGASIWEGFIHLIAEICRHELGATGILNTDPYHVNFRQPVMSARLASGPQWVARKLALVERGLEPSTTVADTMQNVLISVRKKLYTDHFFGYAFIEEVIQEDREIFLLKAPRVTAEALADSVRAIVDGAANDRSD